MGAGSAVRANSRRSAGQLHEGVSLIRLRKRFDLDAPPMAFRSRAAPRFWPPPPEKLTGSHVTDGYMAARILRSHRARMCSLAEYPGRLRLTRTHGHPDAYAQVTNFPERAAQPSFRVAS